MREKEPTIEELYRKYSERLYFTSLRITANTCDAEEVMQDTFLKYYQYPQKKEIEQLDKWLASICIRKSIDVVRSRNRDTDFLESYASGGNNMITLDVIPESMLNNQREEQLLIEKIKQALNSLPDKYRMIVSLHLFEGYDYQEIEQVTGIKESYIRSLYMRGKDKLAALVTHVK